jgi:hypothetical protein
LEKSDFTNVNELVSAATVDLVKQEDLKMFQKLQREFEPELRILRDRVDEPGTKTTPLERQQFSTTSKLRSDVIESH